MEANEINPVEFREAQRTQWDSASPGWKKNFERMHEATHHVSERLVELAGVKPGSRVLDVAAGQGEPAITAARVAGPDGAVVATDISPEMLAVGRERAANEGVENIEFVEAEAVELDFPAESFDAAVSRWGIIFEPDGEGAAARVRGFLKPGSRMAISSWGEPAEVPFIALPMKTTLDHLGLPPPPPGTPGPLSRPTDEAIGGILDGGGFSDVEVERTTVTIDLGQPEEFTTFVLEIAAPIAALIAPLPPDEQEEARGAITEAVRPHAGDDGTVTFENVVLLASGRA